MRICALLPLVLCAAASVAHADPRADIEAQIKTAMGSYDLVDYDAAKHALAQALEAATNAQLDHDPIAARAYVDLGVVLFAAGDQAAAKLAFAQAVKIDPKIQIEPAYRSPENAKLLDDARPAAAPSHVEHTGSGGDQENPLPDDKPPQPDVQTTVEAAAQAPAITIGLAIGGGFGFIRGADTTENMNPISSGGFGHSLVVAPEVMYRWSPQLAIGGVARLALPYDANIGGHSSIGPAGLVRARYTPEQPPLDGLSYMAELGAGITRSTLTIDDAMPSQGNIDIVAQGPLLVGGGVSYARPLSSSFTFVADASLLLGIAVVDKIGLATMNTGATLDLSIGVAFGL